MQDQVSTEKRQLKIPTTFEALIEALIFAAHEPLTPKQIKSIFQDDEIDSEELRGIDSTTIQKVIDELNQGYAKMDKPFRIIRIAEGYQFATLPVYADWLGKLHKEQQRRRLSQSGIETLAIIAYKQPVTKAEIERIRGVNCDYVLKALLEKELITVTGRAETVGRPLLYGTTSEFLKHFGLNSILDLPRPREIEEILGESQYETERRMLEAQENIEKAKKEQEEFKSRLPHIPKKKAELESKEVKIVPKQVIKEIKVVSNTEKIEDTEKKESISAHEGTTIDLSIDLERIKVSSDNIEIKSSVGNRISSNGSDLYTKSDKTLETLANKQTSKKRFGYSKTWVNIKEKIVHLIKKLFA